MKLACVLVLVLVACKSHKPAAPAAGSATAVAPAPKAAPTPRPELPAYTAPEAPDDEVVPAQAQAEVKAGSAMVMVPVAGHDPLVREVNRLDVNHDGKLTPDEVKKQFGDDVDTNGDGQISKDELQDAMRERRMRARAGVKR